MAGLLKIGGLWKRQDKNGNEMLSGKVDTPVGLVVEDGTRIVALVNNRKSADNHPDYEIFLSKDDGQGG